MPLQVPLRHTSNWLQKRPLPWLERKTVVLVGDDVERAHARDFCRLAGGQYAVIDPAHPLSPRPFRNGIDEKWLSTEANALNDTRPTVCYLPGWDFALVTIFHYGLAHRVEFEHEVLLADPHYYPPGELHLAQYGRCQADSLLPQPRYTIGSTTSCFHFWIVWAARDPTSSSLRAVSGTCATLPRWTVAPDSL